MHHNHKCLRNQSAFMRKIPLREQLEIFIIAMTCQLYCETLAQSLLNNSLAAASRELLLGLDRE